MAVDDGVGELVVGDKMRDGVKVQERDALAYPGGDAARKIVLFAAQRSGQFLEQDRQIGVPLPVRLGGGLQAVELGDGVCAQVPLFPAGPLAEPVLSGVEKEIALNRV